MGIDIKKYGMGLENDNIESNLKEMRRINTKMKNNLSEIKEKLFDISCEEGQHLEIIYVNKIRAHASGSVSFIKNYNKI